MSRQLSLVCIPEHIIYSLLFLSLIIAKIRSNEAPPLRSRHVVRGATKYTEPKQLRYFYSPTKQRQFDTKNRNLVLNFNHSEHGGVESSKASITVFIHFGILEPLCKKNRVSELFMVNVLEEFAAMSLWKSAKGVHYYYPLPDLPSTVTQWIEEVQDSTRLKRIAFSERYSNSSTNFEFPTLEAMWEYCHSPEIVQDEKMGTTVMVAYMHSKSDDEARRRMQSELDSMAASCVRCMAASRAHVICGVNAKFLPWCHFSGNYFMARCDYVRNLSVEYFPEMVQIALQIDRDRSSPQYKRCIFGRSGTKPPQGRFVAEWWIANGRRYNQRSDCHPTREEDCREYSPSKLASDQSFTTKGIEYKSTLQASRCENLAVPECSC